MSERDPLWDGLRDLANENHKARIAKTPSRIQYAISQFEKYDIEYALKMKLPGIFIAGAKSTINFFNFTLGQEKFKAMIMPAVFTP